MKVANITSVIFTRVLAFTSSTGHFRLSDSTPERVKFSFRRARSAGERITSESSFARPGSSQAIQLVSSNLSKLNLLVPSGGKGNSPEIFERGVLKSELACAFYRNCFRGIVRVNRYKVTRIDTPLDPAYEQVQMGQLNTEGNCFAIRIHERFFECGGHMAHSWHKVPSVLICQSLVDNFLNILDSRERIDIWIHRAVDL